MTNPPHPLWLFFGNFPATAAADVSNPEYPPAQAVFLAVGQIIFGHPWFGVLFSTALLCAASCWMLQAWVPSYIALLGGVLAALHVAVASYWVNTYWGGSVAALGGCLVLGAARRLLHGPRAAHWLALALGIALLANSRPYEGLVFVGGCAVVFFIWARTDRRKEAVLLKPREIIPALTLLACMGCVMLFYNFRVTGSAWMMPIQAHERQYAVTSPFRFAPLGPEPVYHSQALHDGWAVYQVALRRAAREHLFLQLQHDVGDLARFFPGLSPVWLPLLAFPFALGRREARFIALLAALLSLGMLLEKIVQPHYAAPGFALAILMIAFGFRTLRLLARATTRDGLTASRLIASVLSLLVPRPRRIEFCGSCARPHLSRPRYHREIRSRKNRGRGWPPRRDPGPLLNASRPRGGVGVQYVAHRRESRMIWARDRVPGRRPATARLLS